MSKAEKFISDCTRRCSNELIAVESRAGKEVVSYHDWLTPDQALKAVEIEMEEVIEKACQCYCDDICEKDMCGMCYHKHDGKGQIKNTFKYNECNELQILINAMKDE
jgi:hypothetical protein